MVIQASQVACQRTATHRLLLAKWHDAWHRYCQSNLIRYFSSNSYTTAVVMPQYRTFLRDFRSAAPSSLTSMAALLSATGWSNSIGRLPRSYAVLKKRPKTPPRIHGAVRYDRQSALASAHHSLVVMAVVTPPSSCALTDVKGHCAHDESVERLLRLPGLEGSFLWAWCWWWSSEHF